MTLNETGRSPQPPAAEALAPDVDPYAVGSYAEFAIKRGLFYSGMDLVADPESLAALRADLAAFEAANPEYLEEDNTRQF